MLLDAALVVVLELAYLVGFYQLGLLQLIHFLESHAHRPVLVLLDIFTPNLMLKLRKHLLLQICLLSGRFYLLLFALCY